MQEKQADNNKRRYIYNFKNGYADLKRRHQNDENQEGFYVGRSWQTLIFKTSKI